MASAPGSLMALPDKFIVNNDPLVFNTVANALAARSDMCVLWDKSNATTHPALI
jgi:hypothetical protein